MSSVPKRSELRAAVEDVLYASAVHLDSQKFESWLQLTAPEFRYRITSYSHDLRKDMTWLDHDRAGLTALLAILPKHHVNGAQWLRQTVLYTLDDDGPDAVRAVSSLAVFQTVLDVGDAHVDGGSSRLFAAGHYQDRLRLEGGRFLLSDRNVRLDTRQLGIGSHLIP
ncbi:MAG TPA: nuclear transport factor 2 family protein [Polyangiaceae bacterium]|nr:nuclear transport factor 2 family protein [Polyangiaceae bacterium]